CVDAVTVQIGLYAHADDSRGGGCTEPELATAPGREQQEGLMSTVTTRDGVEIYYKDWGEGPPVVFSHGWPLNADAWDAQLLFLARKGFRVIAHDRRGHGRSSQPSQRNDMDGYADDLAAVIDTLNLSNVTLVGHSTGGG